MRRPSCVCNASVAVKDFVHIWLGLCDKVFELGDLSNFLECKHFIFLVSVDCEARRVIASVLQTRKT